MASDTKTVTSKGQVVIPVRLRRKLKIKPGTRVTFTEHDGQLLVTPMTRERIAKLCGILKGKPSPTEFLLKERKKDRLL